MNTRTWKTIAIVFFLLFVLETGFWIWIFNIGVQEEENAYDCYYNFCSGSYDADYDQGLCTCYDLDVMGNYVVSDTEYVK